MSVAKSYYVESVPGPLSEKLEALKKAGFDYREVVIKALGLFFEKGLDACAKDLVQDKMRILGLVKEKEVEKVAE